MTGSPVRTVEECSVKLARIQKGHALYANLNETLEISMREIAIANQKTLETSLERIKLFGCPKDFDAGNNVSTVRSLAVENSAILANAFVSITMITMRVKVKKRACMKIWTDSKGFKGPLPPTSTPGQIHFISMTRIATLPRSPGRKIAAT